LHSGSSQYNRVLKALDPAFAKVDERGPADLILFAKEYSRQLTYYNLKDEPDGNWLPLMQMDMSVVLATLGNQRINDYKSLVRQQLQWLADRKNNDLDELSAKFTFLFDFAFSWLYELETQCRLLPLEWPYRSWLTDTIRATLALQLNKLNAYFALALENGCITTDYERPTGISVPFAVESAIHLREQQWQDCWTYNGAVFKPVLHGILPVDKIKNTAAHNLFTGIFDTIFKQGSLIVQNAGTSLESSLTDFPQHTPHYALFLAFIRLYRFAQDELNEYTGRHLDFYYKDILKMLPGKDVPDQAHLLVTLQKNVPDYLIPAGMLFKGAGITQYAAENDVLITKATVAELRGVRVVSDENGPDRLGVYMAPVVNSADGKGKAIVTTDKSWQPFGPANTDNFASLGLAISSPLLYLREGTRSVKLTFSPQTIFPDNDRLFDLRPSVQLTGPKGWIDAQVQQFGMLPPDNVSSRAKFVLEVLIPAEGAAIVPYNAAVHQASFQTDFPLIRILFGTASTDMFDTLREWSNAVIGQILLQVNVQGVKQLLVRNDLSLVDITKPFLPFGPSPYAGSGCIIGNSEIFQKRNAQVTLHINWDKVPQPEGIINHLSQIDATSKEPKPEELTAQKLARLSEANAPQVIFSNVEVLEDGKWEKTTSNVLFSAREMFGEAIVNSPDIPANAKSKMYTNYPKAKFNAVVPTDIPFVVSVPAAVDFGPDKPYSNSSLAGFVKLVLNDDLGHKDFIQRFSFRAGKQLMTPPDPYTPMIKAITADYSASQQISLDSRGIGGQWGLFSLHPFGCRKEGTSFSLLPPFEQEGELYIGLRDATVNTTLQLLFQVSEGSANPLRTQQPVQWQYLSAGSYWKNFEASKIKDDTNGLLHTGIIAFALPAEIETNPTIMGGSLIWLRAVVITNADAICNLTDIRSQAIKVKWNTAGEYTQAAPAGTIVKPVQAIREIKTLEQPYNSYGGQLRETDAQFYLRSSERLRHKHRAVTIWDYEHLVLQAFPEIYRVKCLNHTKNNNNADDNEFAPGYTVVVPIPDISKQGNRNPLRPLTSLDTLTAIENYLRKITSGFVRLQVRNPLFEEVIINCAVKFMGDNGEYYKDLLLSDLQQFMSPWAYNPKSQLEFGGKINKSTLISFLEGRSYIDYLKEFKMYLRSNDGTVIQDMEEITTSTSRSILVCAPADLHVISLVQD
jgi:hypothetical protein